jgi:hypothetical protein
VVLATDPLFKLRAGEAASDRQDKRMRRETEKGGGGAGMHLPGITH